MGVKYDWLRKRIRGWVHKAIEAGWGGALVKYFTAVRVRMKRQVWMI